MKPVRTLFDRTSERPADAHLVLGGIVVAGFVLRAYALGAESLWVDEMHTTRAILDRSLANIVLILPVQDPHPPFYYVVLWFWTRVTGVSATAVRSLSMVASVLSIPLVYVVAERFYDRRVGLFAALLFALSPFYVWYAREARMYALMTLLGLVSVYAMLAWLGGADEWWRRGWSYWVVTTALVYTHAFGILLVVAQNVYVIGFMDPDDADDAWFDGWTRIQGLVGLAAIPLMFNLLGGVIGGGRFQGNVSWIPDVTPFTLWEILGSYVGRSIPPSSPTSRRSLWVFDSLGDLSIVGEVVTLLALGLLAFLLVRHVRADGDGTDSNGNGEPDAGSADGEGGVVRSDGDNRGPVAAAANSDAVRPGTFLACWLVVPVAAMYAASVLVTPLLFDRFTAVAGVAAAILLARALTELAATERQTLLTAGLVVLVLAVPLTGIYAQPQKEQWDDAAKIVETNAESGDAVLVTPFWANESYQYYADRTDLAYAGLPTGAQSWQVADATDSERVVWLIVSHHNATQRGTLMDSMNNLGYERDRHDSLTDVDVYRFVRN